LTEKSAQVWVYAATRVEMKLLCYKVRGRQFYETVCVGTCYALAA